MDEILSYIGTHWVEWLFGGALTAIGVAQRAIFRKMKTQKQEHDAVKMGMQAILRDMIVSNYNKYLDKGYMPIYARESVKKIYEAYTDLGGNDVAHDLYEKMRHWDTDPDAEGREE